jgi:hypothetical protein
MVKCDSSLQRTCFHCCRVQWRQALHHFTPNPFHETPDEQFLCWHCFQRHFGTWCWVLGLRRNDFFYTLLASVLGSPILWACVAYHFVDELLLLLDVSTSQSQHLQLTRVEIWLTCWKGCRLTVPHWMSLSSSVRPFYCQCLTMEIAWLCFPFCLCICTNAGCE